MELILKQIVIPTLILLFKATYALLIYYRFNYPSKKIRNVMTALSTMFPIITGIVCIVKYRRSKKDVFALVSVYLLLYHLQYRKENGDRGALARMARYVVKYGCPYTDGNISHL